MQLFLTIEGQQSGPHSVDEVRSLLTSGKLSMGDYAWHQGCAEWTRLHEMPEVVAVVLPPLPSRLTVPPPLPTRDTTQQSQSAPAEKGTHPWWNPELWPDPTIAQLERRKKRCGNVAGAAFLLGLVLFGLGWLFEGKQKHPLEELGVPKDQLPVIPNRQPSHPFLYPFRIASNGPLGFLGAFGLTTSIVLGFVSSNISSQIEKARKTQTANTTDAK